MIASSPGREPFQTVADSPSPSPAAMPPTMRDDSHLSRTASRESLTKSSDKDAMFFKSFVFSPEVPIRLDYHGKHVDIEQVCIFQSIHIGLFAKIMIFAPIFKFKLISTTICFQQHLGHTCRTDHRFVPTELFRIASEEVVFA